MGLGLGQRLRGPSNRYRNGCGRPYRSDRGPWDVRPPPPGRGTTSPSGDVYVDTLGTISKIDPATTIKVGAVSIRGEIDSARVDSDLVASDEAVFVVNRWRNVYRIDPSMNLPAVPSFDVPSFGANDLLGGAVLVDDKLFVGGRDGTLYRLDAAAGQPELALDLGTGEGAPPNKILEDNGSLWITQSPFENGIIWRVPIDELVGG